VRRVVTGLRGDAIEKRVVVLTQNEENIIDKCEVVTIGKLLFTIEITSFTIEKLMPQVAIEKRSSTIVKTLKMSLHRIQSKNLIYNR